MLLMLLFRTAVGTCRHTDSAVARLSPVTTMTRMPAERHVCIAGFTSALGGSCIATSPASVNDASSEVDTCTRVGTAGSSICFWKPCSIQLQLPSSIFACDQVCCMACPCPHAFLSRATSGIAYVRLSAEVQTTLEYTLTPSVCHTTRDGQIVTAYH